MIREGGKIVKKKQVSPEKKHLPLSRILTSFPLPGIILSTLFQGDLMSKRPWHIALFVMVVVLAITTDQVTKALAKEYLPRGEMIQVVGDIFVLMYAENEGAFLGLGSSLPPTIRTWALVIFPTFLLVLFVFGLFVREKHPSLLHILTMASIVGGGLSNLFDRMAYDGRVIDFMNFGIGPVFRTGILNVADLWITFGAIVLIIWGGREKKAISSHEGPSHEG